jgi:urease accessory protein
MPKTNIDRTAAGANSQITDLRLLHLADSALPIGALAHSFGLETLAAEGLLTTSNLEEFLRGWLEEMGILEAVFCREAFRIPRAGLESARERWTEINFLLSARKTARESRIGSLTLGRNFLLTVMAVAEAPRLGEILAVKQQSELRRSGAHYCLAFGMVAGVMGFDEQRTVFTFLHQSTANMISGCQRLLPLGQICAARILWNLKSHIVEVADRSAAYSCDDVCSFMPLLDGGAMEHPALSTRLFVS